jgi:hypothetical protein
MNILSIIVGILIEARAGYLLNTCQVRYLFSQFAQSRDYMIQQLCVNHWILFVLQLLPSHRPTVLFVKIQENKNVLRNVEQRLSDIWGGGNGTQISNAIISKWKFHCLRNVKKDVKTEGKKIIICSSDIKSRIHFEFVSRLINKAIILQVLKHLHQHIRRNRPNRWPDNLAFFMIMCVHIDNSKEKIFCTKKNRQAYQWWTTYCTRLICFRATFSCSQI